MGVCVGVGTATQPAYSNSNTHTSHGGGAPPPSFQMKWRVLRQSTSEELVVVEDEQLVTQAAVTLEMTGQRGAAQIAPTLSLCY